MNNQFCIKLDDGGKVCADLKMADGLATQVINEDPKLSVPYVTYMGEGQWLHTVCMLKKVKKPYQWLFNEFGLTDDTLRIACKYATLVVDGMIPYIVSINESWYELHMMLWGEEGGYKIGPILDTSILPKMHVSSDLYMAYRYGNMAAGRPPIDWAALQETMVAFFDAKDKKNKVERRRSGVDPLKDMRDRMAKVEGPQHPTGWNDMISCWFNPMPPENYDGVRMSRYLPDELEYSFLSGELPPAWITPGYEVEMKPFQIYIDESCYRRPSHWQLFKCWIVNLFHYAIHNRKRSS